MTNLEAICSDAFEQIKAFEPAKFRALPNSPETQESTYQALRLNLLDGRYNDEFELEIDIVNRHANGDLSTDRANDLLRLRKAALTGQLGHRACSDPSRAA